MPLRKVMTRDAVTASPTDSILELVRKLEYHEISAMPVVDGGVAIGMVNTDLLSRRTLLRLLQSAVKSTASAVKSTASAVKPTATKAK